MIVHFVWDQSLEAMEDDVLVPFAQEELLCRTAGRTGIPIVHLWRHRKALVLGFRDRKLPEADQAIAELRQAGFAVGVRNSGGAAVPLDGGVLNATLILPRQAGKVDFRMDFARMAQWIDRSVRRFGLRQEIGEVSGAYCPGEYDLHVGGRKFCGLAQRRPLGAVSVQAFIVAEGSGEERLDLVRKYYEKAAGGRTDAEHPPIRSGSVASLQELAGERDAGLDPLRLILLDEIKRMLGESEPLGDLRPHPAETAAMVEQFRVRYDK